jgi:transcriptional regulator with XRE-family HTH domain
MRAKKIEKEAAYYKKLGEKIYMTRTVKGITRGKLSAHLGISLQQVSKYEKGENKIPIPSLIDIAKYLNMPLSYFIDEYKDENSESNEIAKISVQTAKAFSEIKSVKVKKALIELVKLLDK